MTAPDDVRARFEAWADDQGYPMQLINDDRDDYLDLRTQGVWIAWQAAHADRDEEVRELKLVIEGLSQYSHNAQEVRELVEALDVARGKVNHVHLSLANNRVVGGSFSVDDETSCRWMGSLNIAGARLDDVRRALAKFHPTHQEKP